MSEYIDIFHRMELKYNLFDLGKNEGIPYWDFLRGSLYRSLNLQHPQNVKTINKEAYNRLQRLFLILKSVIQLRKNRIWFFTYSREEDTNGKKFDKTSKELILYCKPSRRIVVDLKTAKPTVYPSINHFFLSRIKTRFTSRELPQSIYERISGAFEDTFHVKTDYNHLNWLYKAYMKDYKCYLWLFKHLKPQKIIISLNLQKGQFLAAKKLKIPTYEMQHAGIMHNYIEYSYPPGIMPNSNIAFADNYIMLGKDWGMNQNIPTNRIVLGNNSFFEFIPTKFNLSKIDVLFIGSPGYVELSDLALKLKKKYFELNVYYKLHPNEFLDKNLFQQKFYGTNIKIITGEVSTLELLRQTSIVLILQSSVLFEAITENKRIAILRKRDYEIYKDFFNNPNIYMVDNEDDVVNVLNNKKTVITKSDYYSRFDKKVADEILT